MAAEIFGRDVEAFERMVAIVSVKRPDERLIGRAIDVRQYGHEVEVAARLQVAERE